MAPGQWCSRSPAWRSSTSVINFFLIRVVGMDPIIVGVVILVSLVIDAVLDPAIGRFLRHLQVAVGPPPSVHVRLGLADRGRHHPAVAAAGCLAEQCARRSTRSAMLVILRLCTSVYPDPLRTHSTPELAPDDHERTSLISFRYFFAILGGTVATAVLLAVYLRKSHANPLGQLNREAYGQFFLVAAVVVFVAILGSSFATHRYIPYLSAQPKRQMRWSETAREIWATVANPSLLSVMASGLLSGIAAGMAASLSVFMSYYFWGLSSPVIAILAVVGAPAAILGVVIAPFISRALDKKRTMITVFFLAIFSGVVPVALRLAGVLPPNGSPWIPVILVADGFVAGTLALIGFVIVSSMIADVVEDAAVKTGRRSEGLLFAANGLLPKFTNGFGTLLGNAMLAFVHLPKGRPPGPSTASRRRS